MARTEPARILVAGRTGCGKSTLVKSKLIGPRTIVCDPKGDYRNAGGFTVIDTGDPSWKVQAWRYLRRQWKGKLRLALVPGANGDPEGDLIDVCDMLFKYQRPYHDRQDTRHLTLIAEEMSFSYKAGNLSDDFRPVRAMIRMGRDYGVNMVGVTQSPGAVNRDFRANCKETYLFAIGAMDHRSRSDMAALLPDEWEAKWRDFADFEFLHLHDRGISPGKTTRTGVKIG